MQCVGLIRCKKYFSSLMWIVGSPLGIDRSGLHLVDVNYSSQSMPTFYWNWCSCVLCKWKIGLYNFSFSIPVQNYTCQKLVLIIDGQGRIINEAFVCLFWNVVQLRFLCLKRIIYEEESKVDVTANHGLNHFSNRIIVLRGQMHGKTFENLSFLISSAPL